MRASFLLLCVAAAAVVQAACVSETVDVANAAELEKALDAAHPGTTILLGDGTYDGTFYVKSSGEEDCPITLVSKNYGKALFKPQPGNAAIKLSGVSYVIVKDVVTSGGSYGILINDCENIIVWDVTVTSTQEYGIPFLVRKTPWFVSAISATSDRVL